MDLLLLPLMFGVVYFVMIRPQQKRQQEAARMLASLDIDDDVITVGGLYGSVVALNDEHVDLQVTADGTILRFRRDAIAKLKRDDEDLSIDSADSVDSEDSATAASEVPAMVEEPVITDDLSDRS